MNLGYLRKALAHKHYQFHALSRIPKKMTKNDNAYTHESTSSFYFKKFRNNVTLQWEFGKSELCKWNSLNKVFIYC